MNEIDSLKTRVIELEKANKELDNVFNAMGDLVFVIDKKNVITRTNNAFASFLKTEPQNIIGKKCHELVHKLGKSWPGCPFEKTKQDKKIHVEEVNDPNIGSILLVTISPIFDEKGEMLGAIHAAKDISGIKKAEAALRDSEIKYRTIFGSSGDAIMLLDPEKGFIAGNEAAVRIFGCKDEKEFVAQSPMSFSPESQPDGQPSSVKALKMMQIAMEKGSNFFEWTYRSMNSKEFSATVSLTRLELQGKPLLQATVRDVTEKALSDRRLIKKLRDLEIFYKAAIDRELDIKNLKKKVQELEAKIKE